MANQEHRWRLHSHTFWWGNLKQRSLSDSFDFRHLSALEAFEALFLFRLCRAVANGF